MSMSTKTTAGTQVTSGASAGFEVDTANLQNGNEFSFAYVQGGVSKTVRVLRVDDTTKLPLDYIDSNGARVVAKAWADPAFAAWLAADATAA